MTRFTRLALLPIASALAIMSAGSLAAQSKHSHEEMPKTAPAAESLEAAQSTPRDILVSYRQAIQSLDSTNMAALFSKKSLVFENGKREGSFDNYLTHHLGPELGHFKSFTFTDTKLSVAEMGDTAVADESYSFVIVLKDGRRIERTGVATSMLVREDGAWKILRYHSSSRTPKKPK